MPNRSRCVDPLFDALTSTPAKERTGLAGGSSDGCGYHLFAGLDAEFVAAVARFVDEHGTMRGQPARNAEIAASRRFPDRYGYPRRLW